MNSEPTNAYTQLYYDSLQLIESITEFNFEERESDEINITIKRFIIRIVKSFCNQYPDKTSDDILQKFMVNLLGWTKEELPCATTMRKMLISIIHNVFIAYGSHTLEDIKKIIFLAHHRHKHQCEKSTWILHWDDEQNQWLLVTSICQGDSGNDNGNDSGNELYKTYVYPITLLWNGNTHIMTSDSCPADLLQKIYKQNIISANY
jgi:hypothetical protein